MRKWIERSWTMAAARRKAGQPVKITGQGEVDTEESSLTREPEEQEPEETPTQQADRLEKVLEAAAETRKRAKPRTALELAQERLQRAKRTMEREAARHEVKTGPGKLKTAYKASMEARDPIVLREALAGFVANYMKLFDMTLEDLTKGEPETLEDPETGEADEKEEA